MKVSIVTNAFNQGQFLAQAIESVLSQDYADIEYMVVDPGSTDETQAVIDRYRDRIIVISEPDKGPADGLNKAFARATGDIFGYLNADDFYLPGAVREAAEILAALPDVDAVCAHTWIVDRDGQKLRRSHSDGVNLKRIAYGAAVQMQPSTFIRSSAYKRVGGYNIENRSNWDGELVVDLALSGSQFKILDRFWSAYRVHGESITGTKKLDEIIRAYKTRLFKKIMGRDRNYFDGVLRFLYLAAKYFENPAALMERVFKGPVYGRTQNKD